MYLFSKRLFFLLVVVALMASCRKGELPEEHYVGKVHVTLLNLPNTPKIMMYFDGRQLDTINPIGGNSFMVPAGKPGKLSAYDANKHELLADTLINIAANHTQQFRFAYSQDFGLKGFIGEGSNGGAVPKDSFDVQFFNKLDASFFPLEKYDLSFIFADPETGDILDYPAVMKGWSRGKLSPVIRFRATNNNGNEYTFAAKLIDPATGQVIIQPDGSEFFVFTGAQLGGKTQICTVANDPAAGYITTNPIDL
ncbi:hypothetical protein [Chitinophaga qingshengii]|uniref:DUF4397 domain-containing protein n=1 Tax=Chitinophaga qingshengii TaxID=1569794 RepID=A0ABR7TL81_9BACT|nr:hypothetical protein [Chitinophaga qingshengii]MBC9931250.1 hypothetical protein [Chitinophaga qingshengii]